jgi:hypothetical protein
MFHFDPIIPNRDYEIVRYINGYVRQYKIDSNVSFGTRRRRILNRTEMELKA